MNIKMKKTILSVAIVATCLFAISCKQQPKQPMVDNSNNDSILIENIQFAIVAEEQSSANNKAFAHKAVQEKHKNVAKMFTAKAKSDSIRAQKHKTMLAKITDTTKLAPRPAPKTVTPKSTAENLKSSINDDEYQITVAYPNYIEQATMAGDSITINTLQWAVAGRKKDKKYEEAALQSITANGNDASVSNIWFVCPACGSISESPQQAGTQNCQDCGMDQSDFIVVQN